MRLHLEPLPARMAPRVLGGERRAGRGGAGRGGENSRSPFWLGAVSLPVLSIRSVLVWLLGAAAGLRMYPVELMHRASMRDAPTLPRRRTLGCLPSVRPCFPAKAAAASTTRLASALEPCIAGTVARLAGLLRSVIVKVACSGAGTVTTLSDARTAVRLLY